MPGLPEVSNFLRIHSYTGLQAVRILPIARLNGPESLEHVLGASGANCVVLRDCRGGEDLQRFDMMLSVTEARLGLDEGATQIIASAADSAWGYARLGSFGGKSARFVGLTWDRDVLAEDLRCDARSETAELARLQLVFAARAAGVSAYDSVLSPMGEPSDAFVERSRTLGYDGVALPG